MKTLVFLFLINTPAGGQYEAGRIAGLDFATCDALQRAIWQANGSYIVGHDEYGPIPAIDAACVAADELER